jgi:uncharacterized protein (TIGR02646 family)
VKYIAKRKRHLDCLYDHNLTPPSSHLQATKKWRRFSGSRDYELLFDVLLEEQYGLCAYTELRPEEHGFSFHVEHVKPKSKYPQHTFDYRNLVLSALCSDDLHTLNMNNSIQISKFFGGHTKRSHFDKKNFLSPLNSVAKRNYFLYQSDGKVVPSPHKTRRYQRKAKHTIGHLEKPPSQHR